MLIFRMRIYGDVNDPTVVLHWDHYYREVGLSSGVHSVSEVLQWC